MATITLYKNKVNGVGSLLDDIIKSSNNLDTQLGTLKNTLQGVDSSTCNLQSAVDSISSSSKSEKEKVEDLKKLNRQLTSFIETTSRKEAAVKNEIERSKNEFYKKYSYLKPECEKSTWEKICDAVGTVCEWCVKHWKLIATVALVILSIVLLCTGVGGILAGACWGAIFGAVIGGVSGGLESMANGGSFLDGFENGAFSGAVSGFIMGGAFAGLGLLGQAAGKGLNVLYKGAACASKLGQFIKGTAMVTKVMSTAMGAFDTLALLDKAFGPGYIADFNKKLHQSKAYNIFQTSVSVVATFTGGMASTMKCFVAGTFIMTMNGLKVIESIKAGDMVYSADENNVSSKSFKRVLETYVRETNRLVHLLIGGRTIISTYDHPYYVNGQGFVSAVNLCIGSELLGSDGKILTVNGIYREELQNDESRKVYNFKVEDYHTYFVSELGVLVHNAEQYITENRVPKDKETVLKDKDQYKRTNYTEKGAKVYKGEDGNYYYRDTMHGGKSAHLEVFDKQGNHLGEANPLTGILDTSKADPTKHIKF